MFSNIDISDAYLQIELDDKFKKLVTINTHLRLFQYQRLPFRVKSGPATIQKLMVQMLSGLDDTLSYLDDSIIDSKDFIEHKKS